MKTFPFFLLAATLSLGAADAPETKTKADRKAANAGRSLTNLPEVEGVSKEDLAKFRVALAMAQQDDGVKAAREKQLEKRKGLEFASAAEKKDARNDLEALAEEIRKATLTAIGKADPTLSKETVEKISDAIEDHRQQSIKQAAGSKKGGDAKTPAKPFPLGDKAKTEEKKPEAAPAAK
ncbi:hypothetical protein LBMAG55_18720 [Verrucomicrobiota bacterium]|nr:hypothetical protein LBMAG55_18720 [Verrucomicrobiota bacterium]